MVQQEYLPNLLVIGAMKAGTTSLHSYLDKHSNIFMSSKKEIDYFCHDEKYSLGIDWYKSFFPVKAKVRGESSQNYTKYHWWPDTVKRIHKDLGENVKFIYILRDPLERVYSHYNEMQAQNCAPDDLEAYIRKDLEQNEIVLTSCYKLQLEKFLEYYPLSSFKIITLEDLNENRLKVLNEVFSFLGLTKIEEENLFNFKSNTSSSKKMRNTLGLQLTNNVLLRSIKRAIPNQLKSKIRGSYLLRSLLYKNINTNVRLSTALENELRAIFKKDVDSLRALTGLSFDKWSV